MSITDTVVTATITTNESLVAVGQIPVLATNIDYQLIINNPDVIQIFYDSIVLTNGVGDSGGAVDPNYYSCHSIVLTNLEFGVTNLVPIGQLCVSNEYRTVIIVTNSLPSVDYYTLVVTNLVFAPEDPRCWQTIYHTNFTFETTITTNTTVLDLNFNFVGSPFARGEVHLATRGNRQSLSILARDLLTDSANPPAAMGVFIGDSVFSPAWHRAGIMSKAGTNNLYRFELSSANGAPPSLGVTHIAELSGKLLQLRDHDTNVYAQAVFPTLEPNGANTSFQRRVPMTRPAGSPSAAATGAIRVRYNSSKGSSILQVDARKLAAGNSYCVVYSTSPSYSGEACINGLSLVRGKGEDRFDTSRGEDLPFRIGILVEDVRDMAGVNVFIVDSFGSVHLQGTIPGPK